MMRLLALLVVFCLSASALALESGGVFSDFSSSSMVPPTSPAQRLRVLIDCQLTSNISCRDLEKTFFEAFPIVQDASLTPGAADVVVQVHVIITSPDELYEI